MINPRSNPYVGPRAFEPDETLYGRGRELRLLAAQLISERVVLLHSPSGAGKTSLIQAGLIPLLREENFHILPVARVNLEPDPLVAREQSFNRYVYSVIAALEEGLPPEQRRPLPSLAGQTLNAYLSERPRPAGAPRSDMLIFDQFEEFLTTAPTDREGKQAFFAQLGAALRNTSRWALFSMREDYIGAAAPYVRPLPNRFEVTFRLDLLGADAALQAIQSPARAASVEFSDAAARRLVDDLRRVQVQAPDGSLESVLGEYIEPVQLQVVCYRLWQSLAEDAGRIDLDDLAAVGDVDQSLGDYYAACARSAAERTGLDERALREWFDARLITKEGIRGQVLMGAQSSEGLDNAAVRLLEDAHIIRGEKRAGATWFELSHDRLIQPVRQNNAAWFAQNLSLFQRQAALWAQQGRPDGLLLRGKALEQAEKEYGALPQTADEHAFLAACRKLRAQERLRRGLMTSVAVLFVLSVVFLVLSFLAYNLATARSVITTGRIALADGNPRYAALLALQARQVADIPEAQELLEDATDAVDFIGGRGLLGHLDSVSSVAWSSDGRLASGSYDGTVIIWDLENRRPVQTLRGHSAGVTSVAWSADGRLASGSYDDTVILWDLESGRPVQTLQGHSSLVTSVAWSADGQLTSGSYDGTVILWNLESGKPDQRLGGYSNYMSPVTSVAWSPDGRLASGSWDKTVILWDLESGTPAHVLQGHSQRISSVAWSQDGRLASGSADHTVILWDLESASPVQTFRGHSEYVSSVAWSADGQLTSGSDDGVIILWNLENGTPAQTFREHSTWVSSVAWSPDGPLASGSYDNTVILWDPESGTPTRVLQGHSHHVADVAWSADGRLASGSADHTVILWDLESNVPAQVLRGHSDGVTSVAWSADGRLASGSADHTVILWDLESGAPVQVLRGHSDGVTSVAWSADGRLASGSADHTVILWDLESGAPVQVLRKHSTDVTSVAWSPDGRLASGSIGGGVVVLWDLESGTPAQVLAHGQLYPGISIAWSVDGRLASGSYDKTVILWDLESGTPAQVLRGHSDGVTSVAWSVDGRLVSGSDDNTIILWNLESGMPAQVLRGQSDGVAWSPDGQLALGSFDSTVKVYQKDFVGHPCGWVPRNMTVAEWVDVLGMAYAYRPACQNLPSDILSFPQPSDWQAWLADLGKDLSVFTNYRYLPPRFLLLTWPGRGLVIGAALLAAVAGYFLFRRIQKGSVLWAAAVLAAGLILLAVGLK